MEADRREFLAGLSLLAAAVPAAAHSQASKIEDAILNDPDAPVGGNLRGDVTIVSFFDYNRPFCKTSAEL